ncbi:hypothetical protein NM208_g5690 [Fusarium decemcellulare]|uniref:Uncharacterized protein n=2 Tax=Fusarium decemcellulare TaxID=57161 RepID=A0ACC1SC05_9HYPO|nr:hypothetical protein NM208_g6682 [Fusarium decemcellulare]KAJ3538932.1 hypothetical protein NM208_g5690 [Fusarium decemcellulare]
MRGALEGEYGAMDTIRASFGTTTAEHIYRARVNIWNGTGGIAPEGPHMYKKDGYYYLIIAEGGTGKGHMVTIARSRGIYGPYESNPLNPILTNANTTEYFQAVGHADLFQDASGHWWGVALSMRLGAEIVNGEQMFLSPMGRETVLYPVTWRENEWPILSPVRGEISAWPLPSQDAAGSGPGIGVTSSDTVDFAVASALPADFVHYGFPQTSYYDLSDNNSCGLRLVPSPGNLSFTSNNSKDVSTTCLARRQSHTLFTFSVELNFSPTKPGHEAGVTVFMSDQVHMELGIVSLAVKESKHHFRFHGRARAGTVQTTEVEIPHEWRSQTLKLEIKAFNTTHYAFSAGPTAHASQLRTVTYAPARLITPIFSGALVGIYATTNGQPNRPAPHVCVRSWTYNGDGQFRT